MKKSLFYSIAIHSVLLFFLVIIQGLNSRSAKDTGVTDKKVEKSMEVQLEQPDTKSEEDPNPKPTGKFVDRDCGDHNWYGGIGVSLRPDDDMENYTILEAYDGYPAQKAGLLSGDVLLNPPLMKGEPGSTMNVNVMRGGNTFSVEIVREKICVESN
jgi:C-terminal processing protease CtpA/Prc